MLDIVLADAEFRHVAFSGMAGLFGGGMAAIFKQEATKRERIGCVFGGFGLGLFGAGPVCRYYSVDSGISSGIALALGISVVGVVAGVQKLTAGLIKKNTPGDA